MQTYPATITVTKTKVEFTPIGSGLYQVFVDAVQVSEHITEQEALDAGKQLSSADNTVKVTHDYEVDVATITYVSPSLATTNPPIGGDGGPGTTGDIMIRNSEGGVVDASADVGDPGFDGTGSLSVFKSSPTKSGSRSIQCNILVGTDGFGTFGGNYSSIPNCVQGDEFWWRAHNYWPDGFNFSVPTQGLKHMRMHVRKANGDHIGYMSSYIKGTATDPGGLVVMDHEVAGSPFFTTIPENERSLIGSPIARDTWVCYEHYIKFHATDGSAIWRVWQDGILIFEDFLIAAFQNADDNMNFVYFYTYWNGFATSTQLCYVDDVAIVRNGSPDGRDAAGNKMIGPTGWINP